MVEFVDVRKARESVHECERVSAQSAHPKRKGITIAMNERKTRAKNNSRFVAIFVIIEIGI